MSGLPEVLRDDPQAVVAIPTTPSTSTAGRGESRRERGPLGLDRGQRRVIVLITAVATTVDDAPCKLQRTDDRG